MSLSKWQTIALTDIPIRQREDWQEGVQYKTNWSEDEQRQLAYQTEQEYLAQFQPGDGDIKINPGVFRK